MVAEGERILGVGPVDEDDTLGTSRVVSSADGGATWQMQVLGQSVSLTSMAVGGSGALCAVGRGSVCSADGGATWSAQGLPPGSAGNLDFVSDREGWATGGGLFAALLGSGGDRSGSVLHTDDGATWQEQLSETACSFHDVDFADADHGWVVGSRGAIRYSADGGDSWVRQGPVRGAVLTQVEATGDGTAWILGFRQTGGGPTLLRTTDAGAVWLPVKLPAGMYGLTMRCLSGREAWVAGIDGTGASVVHTQDGGATWAKSTVSRKPSPILPLSMDFVDSVHGWMVGMALGPRGEEAALLATDDGGRTWTSAGGADAFEGHILSAVDFVDASHGWAAGSGLFVTSDGGASWSRVMDGLGWFSGVAAVDVAHVWAGADAGGILSTVDASGDTAPPTTLSVGARGWVRRAGRLELSANDAGGSGLASTEYRIGGGSWQPYVAPLDFPAPADHSGDGVHNVTYRSTDMSGLMEPVQSCAVRVDTVRPVIRLRPSKIGRDGVLRLRLRIDDASCPYVDQFELRIVRRGHRFDGSWEGFRLPTGRWYTFRDPHMGEGFRRGWYRVKLWARDLAGNRPARVSGSVLLVKRQPGRRGTVETRSADVRRAPPSDQSQSALPEWARAALERIADRTR